MSEESTSTRRRSIALEPIVAETFAHDIEVSDRFQKFSEEILRLALAGVAGLGLLLVNCLFNATGQRLSMPQAVKQNRLILLASLTLFGAAALAAVIHRLASTYSLSQHLLILRFDIRGRAKDALISERKRRSRAKFLWLGWVSLIAGGSFLFLGAASLVWFFWRLVELMNSTLPAGATPAQ